MVKGSSDVRSLNNEFPVAERQQWAEFDSAGKLLPWAYLMMESMTPRRLLSSAAINPASACPFFFSPTSSSSSGGWRGRPSVLPRWCLSSVSIATVPTALVFSYRDRLGVNATLG